MRVNRILLDTLRRVLSFAASRRRIVRRGAVNMAVASLRQLAAKPPFDRDVPSPYLNLLYSYESIILFRLNLFDFFRLFNFTQFFNWYFQQH